MKFPPKFVLALLPVTLVHLVAITIFGMMMRKDDTYSGEDEGDSFANIDVEIPGYHQLDAGTELIDGLSSALFPESSPSRQVELPTHRPVADPGPVDSEVVKSETATIFPFEEAGVKRGKTEFAPKPQRPQPAEKKKAKPRSSGEPPPGIRGFRPIIAKKAS